MTRNLIRSRITLRWLPGVLVLGLASIAHAGDVQPDRLNFGTVHQGATVQGSVRVFIDPNDAKAENARVDAPSFVTVDRVDVGKQDLGQGDVRGYCDLEVTIDTSKTARVSAPLVVTVAGKRFEIPVSAKIEPRVANAPRVLVADTPFSKFSTDDAKLFDTWLKLVDEGGFDVDYLEVRQRNPMLKGIDLSPYDSVLLGEVGITNLTEADVADLRKYAEGGGRVILTANYFFRGTVEKANTILLDYGMQMIDLESRTQKLFEVGPEQIAPSPLTAGVKALSFHRPSPAMVLDRDRTMVVVSSPENPSQHFVAIALAGDGQIVSLGVSLWWMWVDKADNAKLLENLLRRRPKAR